MTHVHLPTTRKPSVLSKRISFAGISAVAAAALLFSTGAAEAGTAERKAIEKYLATPAGGSTTTAAATPQQLADAVKAVIAANKKFKPGVVAGEALKTDAAVKPENTTVGGLIADAVAQSGTTVPATTYVGDAAKTAATSTKANALRVPSFVTAALNDDTAALTAATVARASKTAVAAIIAGRAAETTDRTAFTVEAVKNTKLAAAATEIAREVARLITVETEVGPFAASLAAAKSVNTTKVAVGVVAAKPTQAGDVTSALLANSTLAPLVNKGIATYAKAVATAADIEQVSLVGAQLAAQIGTGATGASITKAAGLAKTLAAAILAKTTAAGGAALVSADNKADEIAEVAAYVVGGILGNTTITGATTPKALAKVNSTILAIIKSAAAGATSKSKALKATAAAVAAANVLQDIVASVAFTIQSSTLSDAIKASIKAYLTNTKTATAIGGKANSAAVAAAIALAYDPANSGRLELGLPTNLGQLVEAETDNRNF